MTTAKNTPTRRKLVAGKTLVPSPADLVEKGEDVHVQFRNPAASTSGRKVTVVVPSAFTLTRDDGATIPYAAGTQEMPEEDAAHWFTRARGVQVYNPEA